MRYLILICISVFLSAYANLSQAEVMDDPVIDVITELDIENNIVQVGNYSFEIPATVLSCSFLPNYAPTKAIAKSDLRTGQVAKVEATGKNEDGIWAVGSLTILSGECLEQEMAELDEHNQIRINATQTNQNTTVASDTSQATVNDTEEAASSGSNTNSSSDGSSATLHMENGVWKN